MAPDSTGKRGNMMKNRTKLHQTLIEYLLITAGTLLVAVGVYFFKFQNNFSFGGVTGLAVVVSKLCGELISAGTVNMIISVALLILGFVVLGKDCGLKTAYGTLLLSGSISLLERVFPLTAPLTDSPFLELCFAVGLPAFGSAILFNIDASTGGTDIVAMILRKYSSIDIGRALLISDSLITISVFPVFGIKTGLYSILGLVLKSLVVDMAIENINLCKYFNIVCEKPEQICEYITQTLNRSATVCHAQGAFSHQQKYIVFTVMNRPQAVRLRKYIRQVEPGAFILISNTSQIIGRGFRS